jgi:hypothetical protein
VSVDVGTAYPADGRISVRVSETDGSAWALTLRVPHWSSESWLVVGDERKKVGPGQVVVERSFAVDEVVELELDVTPRWTWPDPRIDSVRGCVAAERGPLVLCVESVDLPGEQVGGHGSGRPGLGSGGERRRREHKRKSGDLRGSSLARSRPCPVRELGGGDTSDPLPRLGQPGTLDHAGLDARWVASAGIDRSLE